MPKGKPNYIRFLPSYVGSKWAWIKRLETGFDGQMDSFKGRPFAELFAGSAVLSANLASSALLVDNDEAVAKILSNFDEQIILDPFSYEDYVTVKSQPDWWRYAYCLQSMSFSGVFRYSAKGGYNVPPKWVKVDGVNTPPVPVSVTEQYQTAYGRWLELNPTVISGSYEDVTDEQIAELGDDVVVVLDPPYEASQASYNASKFDYDAYWERVGQLSEKFDLIIFDRVSNLEARNIPVYDVRKMRVNGGRAGDVEGVAFILKGGEPVRPPHPVEVQAVVAEADGRAESPAEELVVPATSFDDLPAPQVVHELEEGPHVLTVTLEQTATLNLAGAALTLPAGARVSISFRG